MDEAMLPPHARSNYRVPTAPVTDPVLTWGEPSVAGERSDLHKVLFLSTGGTLAEWSAPVVPGTPQATHLAVTATQAAAVLEWLAGRDRLRP